MATVEIKNRWNGNVLFSIEMPADVAALSPAQQLGWAVNEARKSGADLSGAYLSGACLRGAYLSGACLRGADLSDAYLSGAYLSGADLSDAYLSGAYLSGAYLRGADLRGADLRGADLSGAVGVPSSLSEAAAETIEQRLQREAARAARFRSRFPHVPVVPQLDARILERVTANSDALNMGSWHVCETTHCRAGWAVHLAGEPGYELERKYDAEYAGRMIYIASVGHVPNFFADNVTALEDIKARAAEQTTPSVPQ